MRSFAFPGSFEDAGGREILTWHIGPSARPGWGGRFEISTRVHGIDVWGADFDGLEPAQNAATGDRLRLSPTGDVTDCLLTGDLPCAVELSGRRRPTTVRFRLDLRAGRPDPRPSGPNLRLSTVIDTTTHAVMSDWFEDATLGLDWAVRPHRLVCCVTCLYSDYSPAGHGLMGMRCHRDARDQYLAVRGKADYWTVPVTEEVPETYLCHEYERRVPGTGYRG